MAADLSEFYYLQKEIQRKDRLYREAKGALQQRLSDMERQFEVYSLEEAKALFKKEVKVLDRLVAKYHKKIKRIKNKWESAG